MTFIKHVTNIFWLSHCVQTFPAGCSKVRLSVEMDRQVARRTSNDEMQMRRWQLGLLGHHSEDARPSSDALNLGQDVRRRERGGC